MTFEKLYHLAISIEKPDRSDQRQLEWCGSGKRIALARELSGGYEIFLCCDLLSPRLPLVKKNISFGDWTDSSGNLFSANRVILPSDPHFVPVAAFIAEELLRNGAEKEPELAFHASEPIIDMALRRNTLGDEEVIGLVGELSILKELLMKSNGAAGIARSLNSWKGIDQSSRDFVFPESISLEIKATQANSSIHHVNHISQVDPTRSASGDPTEELILVSFGFASCDDNEGFSVPDIVNSILEILGPTTEPGSRNEIQEMFLNQIQQYGSGKTKGYVHDEMHTWAVYKTRWTERFCRTYLMNSEAVSVIRRKSLASARFVQIDSIEFSIALPERIEPENPITGITSLVDYLADHPGITFREYVENL